MISFSNKLRQLSVASSLALLLVACGSEQVAETSDTKKVASENSAEKSDYKKDLSRNWSTNLLWHPSFFISKKVELE